MGPEGAGETVDDPLSEEERATAESESEVEKEADEEDKNHSARQSHRRLVCDDNFHRATGGTFLVLSLAAQLTQRELDETKKWYTFRLWGFLNTKYYSGMA